MGATNRLSGTHCPRGHEYGGANALAHGKTRECRACKNLRRREARRASQEAMEASLQALYDDPAIVNAMELLKSHGITGRRFDQLQALIREAK